MRTLTEREVQRLLSTPRQERDRLILAVLYETGCSVGEAAELEVKDILENELKIRGAKAREVAISPSLSQRLREFCDSRQADEPVFAGTHGTITPKRIRQLVQHYTELALGERLPPKTLRYTHFAHAVDEGMDLKDLGEELGLQTQRAGQLYALFATAGTGTTYRQFLDSI